MMGVWMCVWMFADGVWMVCVDDKCEQYVRMYLDDVWVECVDDVCRWWVEVCMLMCVCG